MCCNPFEAFGDDRDRISRFRDEFVLQPALWLQLQQ